MWVRVLPGQARDVSGMSMLKVLTNKTKQLLAKRSRRESARQCRDARVIYPPSSTGLSPLLASVM